jgi:hypothetical protein
MLEDEQQKDGGRSVVRTTPKLVIQWTALAQR